ncbi:hypothetical protein MKZ38_003369 [Zalerion maritima]|uniref:DNA helicase n=1 Tax=Zalerion maritima TaxID=339359 RepID=A0AAD5RN14_9PEZI|nr:hypothetical protein MKZ38_003369 [Zalerion maritima]
MGLDMAPTSVDPHEFANTQLLLLEAEQEAETAEAARLVSAHSPTALQRAGVALTNLSVTSRRTGLGGRTVIELAPDAAVTSESDLPEHGIRTGDIVVVSEQAAGTAKKREIRELEKKGIKGVVVKVGRAFVSVAADEESEKNDSASLEGRVWLVRLADDVTFRRMKQTMEKLRDMGQYDYTEFMKVIFGLSTPSPVATPQDLASGDDFGEIEWIDPSLNDSQKDAIRFALGSKEIALIHGPPGTGKTHTLIELILQFLRRGLRMLVCGPSNISVDNIAERLAPHKVPLVRLGHPARLLPSVLAHSLDVLTQSSNAGEIVRDVRADMDQKQSEIRKARNGRERRAIYSELKTLRKEYRERERRCVTELIQGCQVVLATLHGAGGNQLRGQKFDVVVIDEASQALEAQCWVPLLTANKAVCAGDHLQLPPTIKSSNSKSTGDKETTSAKSSRAKRGKEKPAPATDGDQTVKATPIKGLTLETTLFDRLLALHGPSIKRMLNTQYRMHESIMRFPSDELYESNLVAAEAVKSRLLRDLPYEVDDNEDTNEPVVFIDTQGGDFPERSEDGATEATTKKSILNVDSKSNEMEAALVRHHVKRLVASGVHPEDIAVVTPYNAQLALLASLKETFAGMELGSVDGFQGREKEAVVVSLVRSNSEGEVGFLGEKRRLNGICQPSASTATGKSNPFVSSKKDVPGPECA